MKTIIRRFALFFVLSILSAQASLLGSLKHTDCKPYIAEHRKNVQKSSKSEADIGPTCQNLKALLKKAEDEEGIDVFITLRKAEIEIANLKELGANASKSQKAIQHYIQSAHATLLDKGYIDHTEEDIVWISLYRIASQQYMVTTYSYHVDGIEKRENEFSEENLLKQYSRLAYDNGIQSSIQEVETEYAITNVGEKNNSTHPDTNQIQAKATLKFKTTKDSNCRNYPLKSDTKRITTIQTGSTFQAVPGYSGQVIHANGYLLITAPVGLCWLYNKFVMPIAE